MTWVNTCAACGAEESLDALINRIISDQDTRVLIADVLCMSLRLGGRVVKYLRHFKPPAQQLRMKKAGRVLAELVPDMQRASIMRKGREWPAPQDAWLAGFDAVDKAAADGSLRVPLENNAYLYEVVMRLADKLEGELEQAKHNNLRHRTISATGPDMSTVTEALSAGVQQQEKAKRRITQVVIFEKEQTVPSLSAQKTRVRMGLPPIPEPATPKQPTEGTAND